MPTHSKTLSLVDHLSIDLLKKKKTMLKQKSFMSNGGMTSRNNMFSERKMLEDQKEKRESNHTYASAEPNTSNQSSIDRTENNQSFKVLSKPSPRSKRKGRMINNLSSSTTPGHKLVGDIYGSIREAK